MARIIRVIVALAAGVLLYIFALPVLLQTGWAATLKLAGRADPCPWNRVARYYLDLSRFASILAEMRRSVDVVERDEGRGLVKITTPKGPFWVPRTEMEFGPGMSYLFAEHEWMARANPADMVSGGDIVLDVGAHVGVFTAAALGRGAAKVIAIEPDPVNVECLKRNFAGDIARGRVVIIPEGAWSSTSTMKLYLGDSSGWNSMTYEAGKRVIQVPVRKIDDMVGELNLPRVGYIKMDIEGAEREALAGAREVLHVHRPRLMIDSYHRPDDMDVLPRVIRAANPAYVTVCGPCQHTQEQPKRLIPHMTFYR